MHIILAFSEQSTTFPHIPFVHCNFAPDARKSCEFPPEEKIRLKKLDHTSQIAVFPIFSFVVSDYSKLVETNVKPHHTIHVLSLTRNRQLIFTGSARVTGASAMWIVSYFLDRPLEDKITARKEKMIIIVTACVQTLSCLFVQDRVVRIT